MLEHSVSASPSAAMPLIFPGEHMLGSANLSLWRRTMPAYVTRALSGWAGREVPRFEQTVHEPADVSSHAFSGLPAATSAWLQKDIVSLLKLMFDVSASKAIALKFGVVSSDQCRKFHVDYLRYRLLTTYLGPGTEWVPNEYVNRRVLAEPPEDPEESNRLVVTSPGEIRRAVAGDVLLMRGANHADGLGLVHRSPPIEHLGVRRVVLVLSARH